MSDVKDFTKGSVPKILWSFFLPLFLTNMLQQFYNFADTAIVNWGLGDNAVGAVGNMGSLTVLFTDILYSEALSAPCASIWVHLHFVLSVTARLP